MVIVFCLATVIIVICMKTQMTTCLYTLEMVSILTEL